MLYFLNQQGKETTLTGKIEKKKKGQQVRDKTSLFEPKWIYQREKERCLKVKIEF